MLGRFPESNWTRGRGLIGGSLIASVRSPISYYVAAFRCQSVSLPEGLIRLCADHDE